MTTAVARSRHGPVAQLLIAWSPLSALLVVYALAGWVNAPLGTGSGADHNRLGFGLHVAGPVHADEAVLGAVPSAWLQQRLWHGDVHWWDGLAALVYVTHFVAIPVVTGVAWFRLRDRFVAWLVATVAMTTLGTIGYVVYPAAPPWLAAELGATGPVDRISHVGWGFWHLDWIGGLTTLGQAGSNPVAAMPSLHAGAALLVALFLWPVASALGRTALVLYVLAMALTLVYTGEHHVVDVLAGWAVAAAGTAVGALVRRRVRGSGP